MIFACAHYQVCVSSNQDKTTGLLCLTVSCFTALYNWFQISFFFAAAAAVCKVCLWINNLFSVGSILSNAFFWAATNSASAKQNNKKINKKTDEEMRRSWDSTGSSHHSFSSAPYFSYLCFPYSPLFHFLNHLSFSFYLSRSLLGATCPLCFPPTRAGRKSLERSKPFISRGDLICVQQDAPFPVWGYFLSAGGRVKLSLQWSKFHFHWNLFLEISFICYCKSGTKKKKRKAAHLKVCEQSVISHRHFPSRLLKTSRSPVPLSPACCHLLLSQYQTPFAWVKSRILRLFFPILTLPLCFDKSDQWEPLSKPFPSNHLASYRLKLHRPITK